MAKSATIVNEMVAILAKGGKRADILSENDKKWRKSARTIDRYLAEAHAINRNTQQTIQTELVNSMHEGELETLKSALRTDLEIEVHLQKIAFGEMDVVETTLTNEGMIEFRRKPTPGEMVNAAREIWKRRGAYAPEETRTTTFVVEVRED